jgi:hypothetical protein
MVVPPAEHSESFVHAMEMALFLFQHIYGCSRVPPLSALLQREFRSAPPLSVRRDSLLISQPDWFESRLAELLQTLQQRQEDIAEQAAAAAAMEEEADL